MSTANEERALDAGLTVKVVGKGIGERPNKGDLVLITYNSFLENGNAVEQRQELLFVIGMDQTLEAFDRGVGTMMLQEVANIIAAPEFTYGALGFKKMYGPDDCITFQVTFKENFGRFDHNAAIPFNTRFSLADSLRERGNFFYIRNEDERAVHAYKTALAYMFEHAQTYTTSAEQDDEIGLFALKTYNNLAAAYLRIGNYAHADTAATAALQLNKTNPKSLYRKGMALKGLGDYNMALCFLQCASKIEPANEKIQMECSFVAALLEGQLDGQRDKEAQEEKAKAEVEKKPCLTEKVAEEVKAEEHTKPADEPMVNIETKETKEEKQSLPGWVKWAAGAAAVVGAGYLMYKLFK